MAPGEPLGVPVEAQLTVRDVAGAPLAVHMIVLQEFEISGQMPASEWASIPPQALQGGSVWTLHAFRDGPSAAL